MNNDSFVIPPVECLDNGCTERSEKCNNCCYNMCPWFVAETKKED